MMTPKQILQAARAKIATPVTWCTGDDAVTAMGFPTQPWAKNAKRWDAHGAMLATTNGTGSKSGEYIDAETLLIGAMGGQLPEVYNDEHGHAATLAAFDRAIQGASA